MSKIRISTEIGCMAPKEFFHGLWENIPEEYQALIEERGPLPCEGIGEVGIYCILHKQCAWADWEEEWDYE